MTPHMHNINAMKYSWAHGPELYGVTGDTGGCWVIGRRSVIRLRYTTGFLRQPRMISKAKRLLLNVKCVCALEEMRQVKGKFADRWSCQVSCQVCVWLMRGWKCFKHAYRTHTHSSNCFSAYKVWARLKKEFTKMKVVLSSTVLSGLYWVWSTSILTNNFCLIVILIHVSAASHI